MIALLKKVIALFEYSNLKYILIMKFYAGVIRSMQAVMINCESTLPGLIHFFNLLILHSNQQRMSVSFY